MIPDPSPHPQQRTLWEIPPQSVASGGSPQGSEKARDKQAEQTATILLTLAAAGCFPGSGKYLSRDEIVARTRIKATTACARLGPSGALLMMKDVTATPGVCRSAAGVQVLGYQLSDRGTSVVRTYGRHQR